MRGLKKVKGDKKVGKGDKKVGGSDKNILVFLSLLL